MLTDIDHVGIAVADLESAVELYRHAFGVEPAHRERVESQGVEEVLFAVGTSYIQLLGALGPDTPVGRFLERRGPGVHHVGYRVQDVAEALSRLKAEGVEEVLFAVGTSYIQLLGALGPDTPVGRFLERRGPGVHHIGYRVQDVVQVLSSLKAEGVALIDETPKPGSRNTTIAFVHPRSMGGVLVELVQEAGR